MNWEEIKLDKKRIYPKNSISSLINLEELFLDHGKMSGTGQAVKSIELISKLTNLKYLAFFLNVENKNYDVKPLISLKKLQKIVIIPRYLENGQGEKLLSELLLLLKEL